MDVKRSIFPALSAVDFVDEDLIVNGRTQCALEAIQELDALHRPGPSNPSKRLTMIRDAMESYEDERSHGGFVVEAELSAHTQASQPVFVFTQRCPASEFWGLFLADPKFQPNPDFLLQYEPLPPVTGLCGYENSRPQQ